MTVGVWFAELKVETISNSSDLIAEFPTLFEILILPEDFLNLPSEVWMGLGKSLEI